MFGSAQQVFVVLPMNILGAVLLAMALARWAGLARPPGWAFGVTVAAMAAVGGAYVAFLYHFRPANCFLMADFTITQQPTDYKGLTQRLASEAGDFLRRCG